MGNSNHKENNSSSFSEFCRENEDELIIEETDPELKLALVVVGTVSSILTILSYMYFVWNKDRYIMLQKRNTFLLTLVFLSLLLAIIAGSYRGFTGVNNFSCRHLLIIFPVQFFLIVLANSGRLLSLLWRVGYNQRLINMTYTAMVGGELNLALARESFVTRTEKESQRGSYYATAFDELPEEASENKELVNNIAMYCYKCWGSCSPCLFSLIRYEPEQNLPKNLQFSHFLASKLAPLVLVGTLFTISSISSIIEAFIFVPPGEDCFGCPLQATFAVIPIIIIVLTAFFYFYTLYRLRKVPDALGIKKELLVIGLMYCFLIFGVIALLRIFAPDSEQVEIFVYTVIYMSGFALMSVYMFIYQVWIAKSRGKLLIDSNMTVLEILESKGGRKAFSLYLAANLALENLLFYEAIQKWNAEYEGWTNQQIQKAATSIYNQFIGEDAFMSINISGSCREDIEVIFSSSEFPKALFDRSSKEVFRLISTDLFPRFLQSSYYKAFVNELQT